MKKLKTILLCNSSKYIHIIIILSLALYIRKQPFLLMVVFAYLCILSRKQKSLVVLSLIVVLLVGLRVWLFDQKVNEEFPIIAEVLEVNENHILVKSKYRYIVYTEEVNNFYPGMNILIEGQYQVIDEMNIGHGFSYKEYLKSQNIQAVIYPKELTILSYQKNLNYIPYKISLWIEDHFSIKSIEYIKLFILGNKANLDEDVYNQSKSIGISHLYAVSGMHLGMILLIMNYILSLFYMKRNTHVLILMISLFLYNLITGFSISIIRASLLYLSIFIFKKSRFPLSKTDYLSIIFLLLILYNPYMIFYVGFQLSFLMTYVIILISQSISKYSKIKQLIILSIVTFMFGLPIILAMNKSFGVFNLLYNPIFIIYVIFLLLPGTFIVIILPIFENTYLLLINAFEQLINYADQLNIYIYMNFSHWIFILFYWVLLVYTITLYYTSRLSTKIVLTWSMFILIVYHSSLFTLTTKVTILDVNQGDAILIQNMTCKMLIDTGNRDDYNTIINYLKGQNIRSLDVLLITHSHIDHYGETNDITKDINVDNVYMNKENNNITYQNQLILNKNDVFNCGNLQFKVLNADNLLKNENNNSLVLYSEIHNEKWLFTGDIESDIELKLIEEYQLQIDHLKVAHHGSNTSSNNQFLEQLQPKNAYISVGINSYGMPDKQVIDRFQHLNINLFSTIEYGSIEIVYIGNYSYKSFYNGYKKLYDFH